MTTPDGFPPTVADRQPPDGVPPGGAPSTPSPGPDPFPQIDGYEIVGRLGEGGMGVVWRAVQLSARREVALKLMSAAVVGSDRALARFQREVDLTARLAHPFIARLYAGGRCRGALYYAMELVDGLPLDEHVRSAKLSRPQVLALVKDVCDGVQHAHLNGVMHRDLKPGNVLVDRQGRPRVLDFGLAKAVAAAGDATGDSGGGGGGGAADAASLELGSLAGTPAYMSPEQAAGRNDLVDTRSDVYALGVILFHLLTGRFPHDTGGSYVDVIRRVAGQDALRLAAVDRRADRDLDAVVGKALARSAADRYPTAGGLAADLGRLLAGDPVEARRPTVTYVLLKKARRHRVATGVLALVAGAAAVAAWAAVRAVDERHRREVDVAAAAAAAAEDRARAAQSDARAADARADAASARSDVARAMAAAAAERVRVQRAEADALVARGLAQFAEQRSTNDPGLALLWFAQGLAAEVGGEDGSPQGAARQALLRTCIATAARSARVPLDAPPPPPGGSALHPDVSGDLQVVRSGRVAAVVRGDGAAVGRPMAHPAAVRWACLAPDGTRALTTCADGFARVWDFTAGPPAAVPMEPPAAAAAVGGGDGPAVSEAVFTADGRRVLTTYVRAGVARLCDATTGRGLADLADLPGRLSWAEVSPDGSRAALASRTGTVWVWDLAGGGHVALDPGPGGPVTAMAFGGDTLATATFGTVRAWRASDGRPLAGGPNGSNGDGGWRLGTTESALAVDPAGGRVAAAGRDGSVRAWDVAADRPVGPPLVHPAPVTSVAFGPGGRRVVTGCVDGAVRVWDPATGRRVGMPLLHPAGQIPRAEFRAGGTRVVTVVVGPDARSGVRVWDADEDRAAVAVLRHDGPPGPPAGGAGRAGDAGPAGGGGGAILCAAFSPDGRRLVTGGADGRARLWDAETGRAAAPPLPQGGKVWVVAFSPDGRRVLTGGADAAVRVWDADTGRPAGPPLAVSDALVALAGFGPGGRRVYAVDTDGVAQVWDAATGRPVARVAADGAVVAADLDAREGRLLLATSAAARVWTLPANPRGAPAGAEPSASPLLEPFDGTLSNAAFSPDGSFVLTAGDDPPVRLWEAATGRFLADLAGPVARVTSAAFAPDGGRVLVACADESVGGWSLFPRADGQPGGGQGGAGLVSTPYAPLSPAHGRLLHLGFNAGSRAATVTPRVARAAVAPCLLVTAAAADDGTARVWDADTGLALTPPLENAGSPVRAAAVSPDRRRAVTVAADGAARLWDLTPDDAQGSVEDVQRLVELLACRQLDTALNPTTLSPERWAAWWRAVREKRGHLLRPRPALAPPTPLPAATAPTTTAPTAASPSAAAAVAPR